MSQVKRILVLGAAGMLGNAVLRVFERSTGFKVVGSVRSEASRALLPESLKAHVVCGVDPTHPVELNKFLSEVKPAIVINCIGVVKQLASADDPLVAIPVNALLPHQLARACAAVGARLVHLSTDCVFSGRRGMYKETDDPDARDLYGLSKLLGEADYPNAITLRTSIIGHELNSAHGLLGWFLAQQGAVRGFSRAVFSGLPTVEVARVIRDHVIPHPELHGVYHLGAEPISKFDLLRIMARAYQRNTLVESDDRLVIDRSLDSTRFRQATSYSPATWPELVDAMEKFR